jgi:hypothetical protein
MKKFFKKINLENDNIMAENYYLTERSNTIIGKEIINFKRDKDEFGDNILLVNNFTKKYILNNIKDLSEINFTHPNKNVDPDEYNWILSIKIDEVEKLLKNI